MSDTLSQEEIDALREVVKRGEDLGGTEAQTPVVSAEKIKVVQYDFRKPRLISQEQFHVMEILHEGFAKTISSLFQQSLKTRADVKMAAQDQISCGEFNLAVTPPTYLVKVAVEKHGVLAMDISMPLPLVLLDLLLGGDGAIQDTAGRDLTVLERNVLISVVHQLVGQLSESWSVVEKTSMTVKDIVANPEYLQLGTADTPCVNMIFDVHLGAISGAIGICYPVSLIQSLFQTRADKDPKREQAGQSQMLKAIADVPLPVRAVLGRVILSAGDLGRLKVGDVICLDKSVETPVEIRLDRTSLFTGQIGRRRDKQAVGVLAYAGMNREKKS